MGEPKVCAVVEIEGQRPLAAVGGLEVARRVVVGPWRTPRAGIVTRPGSLDLDDVSAEVCQRCRRQRSSEHPAEVRDDYAVQRQSTHGSSSWTRSRDVTWTDPATRPSTGRLLIARVIDGPACSSVAVSVRTTS